MKTRRTPFEPIRIYFRLVLRNESTHESPDPTKKGRVKKAPKFRKARRTMPKPAPQKKDEGIIYCVVAAHGKIRAPFSTGHRLHRDFFDFKKHCIVPKNNDYAKAVHADLEQIKAELLRLNSQLRHANKPVNAFILVDTYTGKVRDQHRILSLQEAWFAHEKTKNQKKFNTFRSHRAILKHMELYLKNVLRTPDFPLHKVDLEFCQTFYEYILGRVGIMRANRIISFFKRIFKYALMRDMVEINYFEGVEKRITKQKPLEYLPIEQVHSIANYPFSNAEMQMVADIFLLCCYTGLYYNDIMELNKGQHKVERYGLFFIDKNRFKNDQPCFIPILAEANFLLEKYDWELQKHWGKRQDKANIFLKSVFEVCALPLHYSFRTGRKTFLNTMLNEYGFSLEAVSFMAGHIDKTTLTKFYARVNEKRVIQETQEIFELRLRPKKVVSFEAIKQKKA